MSKKCVWGGIRSIGLAVILSFIAALVLAGCRGQKEEAPDLLLGSTLQSMSKDLEIQIEGDYEIIASEYPEAQQYDTGYDAFRIRDGVLYGFRHRQGEWAEIGLLERVSLSQEKIEQSFQNAAVSEGYMLDLPGLLRRMEYRTVSGSAEYYLALPRIEYERHMACVRDGEIEWMKQLLKTENLREEYAYACMTTDDALTHTLDLRRFSRTYLLEVPSTNYVSEGTFRFEENNLILTDRKSGKELFFSEEENGYRFQYSDEPGLGLVSGEFLKPSAWKMLRGIYGVVSADLDGDGQPETVWLGDQGFSGQLGLTISVDSMKTDAFRMYYAEHGEISLVEENGHVYGDILYTPWQREPFESRFEIHYDGETIWVTDEDGAVIENHIDLYRPQKGS